MIHNALPTSSSLHQWGQPIINDQMIRQCFKELYENDLMAIAANSLAKLK